MNRYPNKFLISGSSTSCISSSTLDQSEEGCRSHSNKSKLSFDNQTSNEGEETIKEIIVEKVVEHCFANVESASNVKHGLEHLDLHYYINVNNEKAKAKLSNHEINNNSSANATGVARIKVDSSYHHHHTKSLSSCTDYGAGGVGAGMGANTSCYAERITPPLGFGLNDSSTSSQDLRHCFSLRSTALNQTKNQAGSSTASSSEIYGDCINAEDRRLIKSKALVCFTDGSSTSYKFVNHATANEIHYKPSGDAAISDNPNNLIYNFTPGSNPSCKNAKYVHLPDDIKRRQLQLEGT